MSTAPPSPTLVEEPDPAAAPAVEPSTDGVVGTPQEETVGRTQAEVEDERPSAYPAREDDEMAEKPRRRLKVVTALGLLVAVAAAGGAGVVMIRQDASTQVGSPTLTISIPERPVRQRTADGQDVITTTAQVSNDGTAPGRVPELKATMRTPDGRVVKQWRVAPPAGSIAPKASTNVRIGTTGTQVPQGPLTLDVDMIDRDGR